MRRPVPPAIGMKANASRAGGTHQPARARPRLGPRAGTAVVPVPGSEPCVVGEGWWFTSHLPLLGTGAGAGVSAWVASSVRVSFHSE